MCLIIVIKEYNDQLIKDMETAYSRNSDGFGLMYSKNNKLITDKIIPKNFKDCLNLFNLHKEHTNKMAIHFRFTTEGVSTLENCHPFISFDNENKSIGLMHNGARLPIPLLNKKNSDTYFFNENYLKPLFRQNKNILNSKYFIEELESHINSDKLVFLDSKANQFFIINSNEGNYVGKNWYSNDYWNIIPTSSYNSYRNYDYSKSFDNQYNYDTETYNNLPYQNNFDDDYSFYPNDLKAKDLINMDLKDIDLLIDDLFLSDQQEILSELIFELCEKLRTKTDNNQLMLIDEKLEGLKK